MSGMQQLQLVERPPLHVVARTEEHLEAKLRLSCGCLAVVNYLDLAARSLTVGQAEAVLLGGHVCDLQTQKKLAPPEGEASK